MSVVDGGWTGRETRILRQARRMSVREFAEHLGVSDRMVSKWEASGTLTRPGPLNQGALDESLRRCSEDERRRFDRGLDLLEAELVAAENVRLCLVVDVPVGTPAAIVKLTSAVKAAVAQSLGRR
jgi:transcriptional regulator with XRE-family HTH domain